MAKAEDGWRWADHPLMPQVGTAVGGRYQVEAVLGEGGFGAVYLATDLKAGGRLALKVLDPGKSSDPSFAKRFEQEVRVVRSLSHHNTIKIWDVGETETGCAFMAMELVEGESLSSLLEREGPLPPARAYRIAKQVLQSLAEAHELGIIHRDLKPDNIMIRSLRGEPDYVKVLDFGIAKAFGELSMVKTESGMVLCTASYAAAELLRNRDVTPAADVYAMGLILVEMLTGETAVAGDSLADIIAQQMSPDPVPLPEWVTSSPFGSLIERAVAKEAEKRYRDADAMLIALERLEPVVVRPPGAPPAAALVSARERTAEPAPLPSRARSSEGREASEPIRASALTATEEKHSRSRAPCGDVVPVPHSDPVGALDTPSGRVLAPPARRRRGVWVAVLASVALGIAAGAMVLLSRGAGVVGRGDEFPVEDGGAAIDRVAAHLDETDPHREANADWDVEVFRIQGLDGVVLARAFDRSVIHGPIRRCFLVDEDVTCNFEAPLLEALVVQLDLGARPERLDDDAWLDLVAFGFGLPRDAIYESPADLDDATGAVGQPLPELVAMLPLHPPEVQRSGVGLEAELFFNLYEEHTGWLELRRLYVVITRDDEVRSDFETVLNAVGPEMELRVFPRPPELAERLERARVRLEEGDAVGALRFLDRALEWDQDDPEVHALMVEAYLTLGEADGAAYHLAELERCAGDDPRIPGFRQELASSEAGRESPPERGVPEGQSGGREFVEASRSRHERVAMLLEEARSRFDSAPDEALRLLEEAREIEPGEGEIVFRLGMAHLRLGHRARATRHLETYLRRWPDGPFSERARSTLDQIERR